MSRAARLALIDRHDPALPVTRQCGLMTVSRSSVYRPPAPASDEDLAIMALIDRQYLARPYYGSRRMAAWLATQGHRVNRKRVQRLMRLIGLVAVYQRPNTSQPAAAHKVYPDGQGVRVSGRDHGLAQSCGTGLAAVEHARRRFLRRGARGSARSLWSAGDLQHRPGQPVHQRRLHRRAEPARGHDQHGWQGALHGQRLHRAAVAQPQIRGGLPACLWQRRRGSPTSRASSKSGEMLAFVHIPTGTTTNTRIDQKGFDGKITSAPMAIGADIEIGRATALNLAP